MVKNNGHGRGGGRAARFFFCATTVPRTGPYGIARVKKKENSHQRRAGQKGFSFVVHQQISKAAVAGDAENINKQARKERTDWINKQKNKQATNGFLSSAPVGGARAA